MHLSPPADGRSARSRTLLAALIAAFLFVPACTGGEEPAATGDETAGSPTTAVPSETEAVGAAEAEVSDVPASPPSENESSEQGGSGTVAGIDLDADYCEIAEQAGESGLFSGEGPQTPEDLTDAAERTRQISDALVRQAPDEIASDVEVSTRSLSDLLSVLEGQASRTGEVGADAGEDPDVQAAIDALGSQEVQSANDRVTDWRRENC
jgi:hypothetical protein